MEERRAGPLLQFLWDLATMPTLHASYLADPRAVLTERGLNTDDVFNALQGDQALLAQLLRAEDQQFDEAYGPRVADIPLVSTFP